MYQGFYWKGSYVVYLPLAHFFITLGQPSRPCTPCFSNRGSRADTFSSFFEDFSIVLCQLRNERRALGWRAYFNVSVFFSFFFMFCWFFYKRAAYRADSVVRTHTFTLSFYKFYPRSTHDRCLKTLVKSTRSTKPHCAIILKLQIFCALNNYKHKIITHHWHVIIFPHHK